MWFYGLMMIYIRTKVPVNGEKKITKLLISYKKNAKIKMFILF